MLPAGGSIGIWGGRRWRVGGAGVAAAAVSSGGGILVAVRGRKQADEHHRGERKVLACLVWVLGAWKRGLHGTSCWWRPCFAAAAAR